MTTTDENNTQEASSVQRLVRRWYFTVEDFDDNTEYLGPDGESIDDCDAKRNPFLGTLNEAAEEADRRANRWEEREDCCASNVTYHSMGKVKDGEAPNRPSSATRGGNAVSEELAKCRSCGGDGLQIYGERKPAVRTCHVCQGTGRTQDALGSHAEPRSQQRVGMRSADNVLLTDCGRKEASK